MSAGVFLALLLLAPPGPPTNPASAERSAAPTAAEVTAAQDRFRANNALVDTLRKHAETMIRCSGKALDAASPPSASGVAKSSGNPQADLDASIRQMITAAMTKCGAEPELRYWAASLRSAYPDMREAVAEAVAANAIGFFIFDSVINAHAGADATQSADSRTAIQPEIGGLFEVTCLAARQPNGSIQVHDDTLAGSGAVRVSYDALPASLRDLLKSPASTTVWQLRTTGRSYLYVSNPPPAPRVAATICGIASDAFDYPTAENWVFNRSGGRGPAPVLFNMRKGYLLSATKYDNFAGMQVNWMSEAAWQDLQKRQH